MFSGLQAPIRVGSLMTSLEGKRVGADDDAVGDGKFASHFGFRFFLSSVCEV